MRYLDDFTLIERIALGLAVMLFILIFAVLPAMLFHKALNKKQ